MPYPVVVSVIFEVVAYGPLFAGLREFLERYLHGVP